MTTGVVLGRRGGTFRVYTEGAEVTASLRGKLKFKDDDRVVAGDVVELEGGGGGGRHGRSRVSDHGARCSPAGRRVARDAPNRSRLTSTRWW